MTQATNFNGLAFAPRRIMLILGAYLISGLLALYLWNTAGRALSFQAPSETTPALSITCMAFAELWLYLVVLRGFPAGAPLRFAWLLLALSAAFRAASGTIAQVFGTSWLLSAAGPLQIVLLALGTLVALGILRKFGFWVRPAATDWALGGLVGLFTLCRAGEVIANLPAGTRIGVEDAISVAGHLMLFVLFLEAMLLRQSVARMGGGLIAKGWGALACGVFLTGIGDVTVWIMHHYSQTGLTEMITLFIRLMAAGAFLLAPAYQVAAQSRATQPPRPV